jgi:hypothetical protein
VRLVGFIIRKFVTMRGQMNVKITKTLLPSECFFSIFLSINFAIPAPFS